MGVRATLVVSLMVSGRLWGSVSAHHYVPRFVHFEERAVCELLAEAVATRISALESFSQAQAELSGAVLEQRMIRAISSEGDWRGALFDGSRALLEAVEATGAALLFEDEVRTVGDVPSTLALREIGRWLDAQPRAARDGDSVARPGRPAVRVADGHRERIAGHSRFDVPRGISDLAPPGARSHGDLGRQSVQADFGRRRCQVVITTALVFAVALGRRGNRGSVERRGPRRRSAGGRHR